MKLKNKIVALFLTVACAFGLAVAGNATKVNAEAATYTKVTVAPDDWSGTYLIVAESAKVILNGSLTSLDVGGGANKVDVTIDNGTISGDYEAYEFTIAKNGTGYSIKSASGKYIGNTSNANKLVNQDTALVNTITLLANGDADIVSASSHLRWNNNAGTSNLRFRYYKSGTYTQQQPVQLYLKGNAPVIEKTDAEKLAVAKENLTIPEMISGNITLPTVGDYDTEITWESSDDGILDFEGYVERPTEDTVVTLTATITLGDLVETKEFQVTVKGFDRKIVTNPSVGTYYKLLLEQGNLNKTLYTTGSMDGYYYETTEDASQAALVSLEEADGGYYLVSKVAGVSKYMNIVISGNYKNVKYEDTAKSVWTFNREYNTLMTKATDNNTYFLGTYNTFDTFSACAQSFLTSNFVSHLVELTEAELEELNALKVKVGYQVGTKDEAKALRLVAEFNLTAEDLETFESTIAFRVTKGGVADERAVTTLYSSVNPMNDEAELTGAYYAVLTYVNVPAGEYTVEVLVDGEVAATVVATVA